MGTIIKLFTEQSHNLCLSHEPRDRKLGTYADNQKISCAQAKLYDKFLHTDQVIWCSRCKLQYCEIDKKIFLHEIHENIEDRVAILDGMVWERILGRDCIPDEESLRIRLATRHFEPKYRNKAREKMKEEFLKDNLPREFWENLITNDINCRMPQILLQWPLTKSKIHSVKQI